MIKIDDLSQSYLQINDKYIEILADQLSLANYSLARLCSEKKYIHSYNFIDLEKYDQEDNDVPTYINNLYSTLNTNEQYVFRYLIKSMHNHAGHTYISVDTHCNPVNQVNFNKLNNILAICNIRCSCIYIGEYCYNMYDTIQIPEELLDCDDMHNKRINIQCIMEYITPIEKLSCDKIFYYGKRNNNLIKSARSTIY